MENLSIPERNVFLHKLFQNMIKDEDLQNRQIIINNSNNNKVAVIIEPRRHEFMEEVVRNVMYMLPQNEWNLHIITYKDNVEWLVNLFKNWRFQITALDVPNLDLNQYSNLLMSEQFWNNINEENVLIFQTDVMIFNSNIDDFIHYDFIGANYFDTNDASIYNGGNNGGFSFRHKSAMIECIQKLSIDAVNNYRVQNGKIINKYITEDIYFTVACEILSKKMCPVDQRVRFSIEDGRKEFYSKPIGCHRFNSTEFAPIIIALIKETKLVKYLPLEYGF